MSHQPIIAIDGPSGSGKSTISRRVAGQLSFTYIDTGAMYRCVGLAALRVQAACHVGPELDDLLANLTISFEGQATEQRVLLNGQDVTEAIREHAVSKAASDFSALPSVRERLVQMQRQMGKQGGVVMEGRDIGTNVFPHAEVKIYLDATPRVRALRRHKELMEKGKTISFEQVLADQIQRDEQDAGRELNPLCKARDAHEIDTSDLTVQQIIHIVCNIVKKKQ